MTEDEIRERAEACRRALDNMNYYEGTQRRDATIADAIRAALAAERQKQRPIESESWGVLDL